MLDVRKGSVGNASGLKIIKDEMPVLSYQSLSLQLAPVLFLEVAYREFSTYTNFLCIFSVKDTLLVNF